MSRSGKGCASTVDKLEDLDKAIRLADKAFNYFSNQRDGVDMRRSGNVSLARQRTTSKS
jgi:hypothetical protein